MREIKFRSWDKLAKKMSNSYNLQRQPTFNSEHNGKFCISTISPSGWLGFDGFSENERQIAMQYTGLKDKNEVEVYEGDIIKYDFNELNYRIEFLNAGFIARRFYENIENLYPTEFDYGKECEVIGNIYENKELLN